MVAIVKNSMTEYREV